MDNDLQTTMTSRQIESQLKADAARLDRAETRLTEARDTAKHIENGPDSDAMKAQRLSEFEATLSKIEQDAVSAAGIAEVNIEQILIQTGTAVPTLSAAEYAVANNRREDIRDDVDHLQYSDLVGQVRYALTVDDRAALSLYARFVPRRLSDTDGSWTGSGSESEKQELRRMLREIDGRLSDTSLKPLQDKAVALRSRATALDRDARKRELANATFGFQSEHEVAW